MPFFALFYDVVENFVERRAPFREEHLGLVRAAHARGDLLLGGALADPADRSLLVFRAESRSVPENFVKTDPYVTKGLVKRWEVRPWNVVVGQERFEAAGRQQ
jgi:uncharacterized protein